MGNLPGVYITLGNGNLGRTTSTNDGVAGLILTGNAVQGKLELNKHYLLSGTADLAALGVNSGNNFLVDKEVRAFYAQAGEGAELHLMLVSQATTLTAICSPGEDSPVNKLINSAGGRIRLLGVNKLAPEEYELNTSQGIDADTITALEKMQQSAEASRAAIRPFRALLPAASWNGSTDNLYKPREGSFNNVAVILASDDAVNHTAAIGLVLGRASKAEAHQSIGRVKNGAIATTGYFTDGSLYTDCSGMAELLNDAGYVFFMKYPTRNGCYLNGDPMAAPATDDYSQLYLGRVIDKAVTIIYDTYITEVLDNISVEDDGSLDPNQCIYLQNQLNGAIASQMTGQISSSEVYIDPAQNIIATGKLCVSALIVPKGIINQINVDLAFNNPAK